MKQEEKLRTCPICGGTHIVDLFRIYDARFPNVDSHLLQCADCGVGRTYFPGTNNVPRDIYPDNYYSYSPDGYSATRIRLKKYIYKHLSSKLFSKIGSRWLTIVPSLLEGRVLDIGCGCGASLDIWKSLGWKTYGTEITANPVQICRGKGHKVFLSTSPAESFKEENFFDWITLDNVLEHIEAPRPLLRSLERLLKPDGDLTICVPNFGCDEASIFGPYWDALLPEQHVFQYTEKGIRQLLADCGFEIRNVFYQPRFMSSQRMKNVKVCADEETHKSLKRKLHHLQIRKAIHLLTASRISERYGFFMTVTARRIQQNKDKNGMLHQIFARDGKSPFTLSLPTDSAEES